MNELIAAVLLLIAIFFFQLGWLLLKLWRAEKSMNWKPNTCSKDAPWSIQMDCAAQRKRWRDQVWEIATRK